ncbi:MAG: amino acid permease [Candidatus Woesearchaeota archaeon]
MSELKKVISKKAIFIITVNSIMGTGIFFLPAIGAGIAGPASILSWVLLSILCIYISMCFAELTGMFPTSGGVYEFCRQAFGHFWSFIIGWMTFIVGNITIAMLIVGAIQYINPHTINVFELQIPFLDGAVLGISFNMLVCIAFILIFNYIAYRGMQTSSFMLVTFGIITLSTLILLTIPGLFKTNPDNFIPFFPLGFPVIFVGIFVLAETFFGWETATFLAGETKDGANVMPKVLIYGTIVIAIICILFSISALGVLPYDTWANSLTPLTDLAQVHYGDLGSTIFSIMVYLSIIGSVAGWVVSAPRLILTMAEDKLFISSFAKIHPKHNSPYNAIIFQTILISILIVIASASYEMLLELLVPLVLLTYSAVLLSLVVLRYTKPNHKRTYKVPFGKIGPIVCIFILMFLVIFWAIHSGDEAYSLIKLGLSFVLAGIPFFILLTIYYNPDIFIKLNNFLSYFNLLFERILMPKKILNEVDEFLENAKGKNILEFGCGVGTLTKEIVKKIGKKGGIYAVDMSESAVRIARNRLTKIGHENVYLIHDIHQINRIHHSIPKVDYMVSFGLLGYIQDIEKIAKEVKEILPDSGRIMFIDFIDLFKVIPNVNWLSNQEELVKIFEKHGFTLRIKIVKSLFWNYFIIYGIKSKEKVPFI